MKFNKNKLIKYSVVLLIIISVGIFINETINKPTKLNYLLASRVYKAPANTAFTDDNFYKCVVDSYNSENNTNFPYTSNLTDEQLNKIKVLSCNSYNINEVNGLEELVNLEELYLAKNNLISLNISNNTKLKVLHAFQNQLEEIDLSNNEVLEIIYVFENQLESLDVSKTSIYLLDAQKNELTSIDVSNNLELTKLYLNSNKLETIDISKNTKLLELDVSGNELTELDVSNNKELLVLNAANTSQYIGTNEGNQLTEINLNSNTKLQTLNLTNNKITTIDISKNTALKELDISYNKLETIDISDNIDLEKLDAAGIEATSVNLSNNIELKELDLSNNKLETIDISKNTKLEKLNLSFNKLTSLNIYYNENLTSLFLQYNNLTEANFANHKLSTLHLQNNQLTTIDIRYNEIKELNVKNNPLKILKANSNKLTAININENTELEELYVGDNQLTSLNINNLVNLHTLEAYNNNLENLDLSKNINLKSTILYTNVLKNIDFGNNENFEKILIGDNQLTELDVSGLINLTSLDLGRYCTYNIGAQNSCSSGNNINNLDVSNNTKLKELYVTNNELTSIDVNKNVDLITLSVGGNDLTSIDVSKNVNLKTLDASSTNITSINIENNISLINLDLSYSKLATLDISKNTALKTLNIIDSELKSIDISKNVNLTNFKLYNNNFTETIGIYKGESYSFSTELVKLPESKIINFKYAYHPIDKINISTNNIIINEAGEYKSNVQYEHNIQTSINYFSVLYNIYVIEARSEKYLINEEEGYIYTGIDTDEETILNNISLNYGEASVENNKIIIKYENEVVKEFDIVNIQSDKYDLTKDYIFEYRENNITINNGAINKNTENNTLEIKYGEDILETYKLVEAASEKYDLSNSTIRVQDNNINDFLKNINCTNCDAKVYDGTKYIIEGDFTENHTLRIIYSEDVLKEYNLTFPVSGVTINKENVRLGLENKKMVQLEATINPKNAENKNISWTSSNEEVAIVDENGLVTSKGLGKTTIAAITEEGGYTDTVEIEVVDIITYQITYKDGESTYIEEYEENELVELKKDLTKVGYTLIGWGLNDKEYKLTDEFTMIAEDITLEAIWKLIIPDIEKTSEYKAKEDIITGISLGTTIDNLELGLDDIYQVKVFNKNQELKTEGNIATNDKLKIYLGETLVSEYTLSVKGDVTGTGTSTVSDVAKLYQYLKKKIDMEDCYKEAGNVVSTDNEIKINDVAKLYQFIKKKISSLEV